MPETNAYPQRGVFSKLPIGGTDPNPNYPGGINVAPRAGDKPLGDLDKGPTNPQRLSDAKWPNMK